MKKYVSFLVALCIVNSVMAVDVVQFKSIDFQKNIVELHNFGATTQDLDGWRFCSHDENEVRQYSSADGLNGVSIAAGESLFVYWNNDAPTEDANNINLISIGGGGGFAAPFDLGPFGLQIYFASGFGDGNNIADHLQWSLGGVDNESADDRSDEAVIGGVWTDETLWIATAANTARIELTDASGARLHSPSDYNVIPVPPVESVVQFRSVDFTTNVVELHNFGTTTMDLDGWRFCTHDEDEVRKYSATDGLNGMSIAAGESLFVYFNSDATTEDANNINLTSIGGGDGFAVPLDRGPYGMQIYYRGPFGNGDNIADHLQWSIGAIDDESADERSDEAETGRVWTDQSQWIETTADTIRIELNDLSGSRLHRPSDYDVVVPPPESVVQFRSIDFARSVVELHNFGATSMSLDGWRFCTHDEEEVRRYSTPDGLNGMSIAAGESLFVYFNSDASEEDDNNINLASIGGGEGFALPLDRGPYGLQIYYQGPFGNGNNIADHLQWSIDGVDDESADERSDEAESGGVWTDQNTWIATTPETIRIVLTELSGARLHGPSDYSEAGPAPVQSAVQIRSIDFLNSIVELYNFGATTVSLDGWRFCTHDENEVRQYSSADGLNGVSIDSLDSLFVYFNNDAPAEDTNNINLTSIGGGGGFASPLDLGPFGLQIYYQGPFGNGDNIADHLQWSMGGADNASANERSDEAVAGGVWTDVTHWIATTPRTMRVELIDMSGARLHGPSSYRVIELPPIPNEIAVTYFGFDLDGNLEIQWEDLTDFGVNVYSVETSSDLANWTAVDTSDTNSILFADITVFPVFFRVVVD